MQTAQTRFDAIIHSLPDTTLLDMYGTTQLQHPQTVEEMTVRVAVIDELLDRGRLAWTDDDDCDLIIV